MICTIDDIFQTFTKITRKTKMEKKAITLFSIHAYLLQGESKYSVRIQCVSPSFDPCTGYQFVACSRLSVVGNSGKKKRQSERKVRRSSP